MKIHHVDSSTSPHLQRQHQQQDEFDKYFARAALGMQVSTEEDEAELRRASLQPPSHRLSTSSTYASSEQHLLPRRAASCKYPKARRKNSPSPIRGPNTLSPQTAATATGFGRAGGDDVSARGSFSSASSHGDRRRTSSTSGGEDGKFLGLKSKSAPHSRSNSWKRSRRLGNGQGGQSSQQQQSQQLDDGCGGNRKVSVSLEESVCAKLEQLRMLQEDDCYVVRTFATSPEGHLVSRGDSFKRRSTNSLVASGTVTPGGE